MFKVKNKEIQASKPIFSSSKLIKLCYFIIAFLLISCGNEKEKKSTENNTSTKEVTNTKTEEKSATNKTILCFGDSITAGYGLNDTNDAFPAILQQKIDSIGLNYTVLNSGVSGETTAGGKSRIDWVIKNKPEIFLLELGANDGLRGVQLTETKSNLQAIIDVVKKKSPKTKIILAGMQLPPNMGLDYTTEFKQLFIDVAKENKIAFIPFILKDVGGIASLNQNDGIHPNVKGHKIMANTVWEVLASIIK
ncbi:arylesterase [Polaribacter pectinis]|uniref:Arylesterase n=1 Tax=Polaribacter pectinis TaxID=2738844 RepID=A0A7G9LEK4_9FLAO|nr:arylesterase [Polaribacter pectinis]QNM87053.1 arylesterase [Polaribacter pectinis]